MTATAARVAIVTGAARGIGRATADQLHREGHTTVGFDVPSSIAEADTPEWTLVVTDVSDEAAVAALIANVVEQYGRIDVLVNVAGVVLVKPLDETAWDEFRRMVDVNLGGIFLLCKHAVPVMARTGGGGDRQSRLGLGPRRPGRSLALRRDQGRCDRTVPRARVGARAQKHPGCNRQPGVGRHARCCAATSHSSRRRPECRSMM